MRTLQRLTVRAEDDHEEDAVPKDQTAELHSRIKQIVIRTNHVNLMNLWKTMVIITVRMKIDMLAYKKSWKAKTEKVADKHR